MAQPSKKAKRISNQLRELHLKKREFTSQVKNYSEYVQELQRRDRVANETLIAVLAQKGDIDITSGTLEQVQKDLARLGWKRELEKDGKTLRVQLVEQPAPVEVEENTNGPE